MLNTLLQWEVLQKILFNTLFVSLPEEIFWVMFTIAFIGEYWFLNWKDPERRGFKRKEIIKIISIAGAVAIVSNILRFSGIGFTVIFPLSLVIMYVSIVFAYRALDYTKDLGFALLGMLLGVLVIIISQFLYIPFILYGTGKTLEEINNNLLLNFLISIPACIIQYSVLAFLLARVGTILKANVITPILSSLFLLSTTLFVVIFNTAFLFIMVEVICYEKVLNNLTLLFQLLIIIGIILLPVLNTLALLWSVYYVKNKETKQNKDNSDKLKKLVKEIKSYTGDEKYDNILIKLNDIEKIAQELHQEEEREE